VLRTIETAGRQGRGAGAARRRRNSNGNITKRVVPWQKIVVDPSFVERLKGA